MPSRRAIALVAVLLSGACSPADVRTKPDPPTSETSTLERTVSALVNRHRRSLGLRPLAEDSTIMQQARLHSAAMAAGKTPLGHSGFDDRVATLRRVLATRRTAENVAFNQGHRDPAEVAVRGWLASRGHRQNIEGPYELTGVGVASNAKGEVYFTQIFVGR
jgi:uncharacterized protein YkwD